MNHENKDIFQNFNLKEFPKGNRKIDLEVQAYSIAENPVTDAHKAITTYITPFGLEFQGPQNFTKGMLVKINLAIPNYWQRKQQYVEYKRIDTPQDMKIIGKVIECEELSKKGKKRRTIVQTLSIDEVDEKVLTSFLKDHKS